MTLEIEHDQVIRICRRLAGVSEPFELVMPDTQKEMTSDETKAFCWALVLLVADVTGLDYRLSSALVFGDEVGWVP